MTAGVVYRFAMVDSLFKPTSQFQLPIPIHRIDGRIDKHNLIVWKKCRSPKSHRDQAMPGESRRCERCLGAVSCAARIIALARAGTASTAASAC